MSVNEPLPGVHLLELPLPFSPRIVNVYLVRQDDGYLLIDCGIDKPPCLQALSAALDHLGISWHAIREILLTHVHPDHGGLAPEVLKRTGARLLMHGVELQFLHEVNAREAHQKWHRQALEQAGTPARLITEVLAIFAENEKSFHKLQPASILQGGERLGPLEVIWTPGHSPGHICLYNSETRTLFSGDHILTGISPNIGWHPGRNALAEYLASLDRVAELSVDLVLPSHGQPFTGLQEWVTKTKAHHRERCRQIRESLPKTPHELVGELWDRQLSPFHYRFAVFEVMAHLQYLGVLR